MNWVCMQQLQSDCNCNQVGSHAQHTLRLLQYNVADNLVSEALHFLQGE